MQRRKMNKELWVDVTGLSESKATEIISFALNIGYCGIHIDFNQLGITKKIPRNIKLLVKANNENKDSFKKYIVENKDQKIIPLLSGFDKKLNSAFEATELGIFISINDKESMEKAIELSKEYKTIVIQFESETNIPLELILAYSQQYHNKICKLINNSDDGWIATMTMEMGSHAVLIKNNNVEELIKLKNKISSLSQNNINLEEFKVVEIEHIGMGDRVCVDTICKLDADEGMILCSTSSGGILVSSENHYLPYMDLRPFRVNAGAIHSYILCPDNRTKYLSELKAGDEVLAVNSSGRTRPVSVGRIKMEKRPMLLIKCKSAAGDEVNVIVQDDWHIRILSSKGTVKNSVLLKPNDTVLGYTMKKGRHLGVAIDETIIER
jgi:3-dehydroquinate synthase II/3-amino-4-hydroxybenzoic acid synthase